MKAVISIIIIVTLGFFLRVNLPSNEISTNISIEENANAMQALILRGALTQLVADWQIRDYLLFKTACSERLELSLVAIPFSKWSTLDKNRQSC